MSKLVVLGDSVFRGVILSEDSQKYTLRVQSDFSEVEKKGVVVKNYSRMGATIDKGLGMAQRFIDEIDSETVVLLEFGGNDCDFDWPMISADPHMKHEPKTPPEKFVDLLKKTITLIREKGAAVAVSTLVPIEANLYEEWISRNLNFANIDAWLGGAETLSRWQEYYSRLAERVAAEMQCHVVALREMFLQCRDFVSLMCADGIHPNENGHRAITEFLGDALAL